ncbi:MAG TPA: hypothetical protein VFJ02_22655 [Vicinamibacterales bacterium]|nr:hypothetical protein [Vicinamibacterales bacterium]
MKTRLYCLRTFICGAVLMAAIAMTPAVAQAQEFGARAGVSVDPDQFYFGGHFQTEPLIDHLHFRPNVEIGVGDDVTLVGFNVEFAYLFPTRNAWQIYAGGGPALNVIDVHDETDAEPGLNVLVGVQHSKGLFFEFKIGAFDSPEFKFGVGYSWKR